MCPPSQGSVWVLRVVLPKQILPVVVPIRRANDDVDVLRVRRVRIPGEVFQIGGHLMIELDQDHISYS
jgi:hypothetical protein